MHKRGTISGIDMINVTKQGYVPNSRSFFFSRTGMIVKGYWNTLQLFVSVNLSLFLNLTPPQYNMATPINDARKILTYLYFFI